VDPSVQVITILLIFHQPVSGYELEDAHHGEANVRCERIAGGLARTSGAAPAVSVSSFHHRPGAVLAVSVAPR
jgi:hypothetical protein